MPRAGFLNPHNFVNDDPETAPPSVALVKPMLYEVPPPAKEPPNLCGFDFNDYGNAQRIACMFGDRLRYSNNFKAWLVYDGARWVKDDVQQSRRLAKLAMLEFVHQIYLTPGEPDYFAMSFVRKSLDSASISNALRMLQPELFIRVSELDREPYLLNFANGTLDLRTEDLKPHDPADYITKLIPHPFNPKAECPQFKKFLARIMDGKQNVIDYVQRAIGYSLTGVTSEKAVFFPHGCGNNGKTTLLSTIRKLVDEYSTSIDINTLMTTQETNNTQADLADLRGARFAVTSETDRRQRLAEGKLKRICQGMGRIKAIRKYENHIEFDETHKLWMDCNHLPSVHGTDNAIWNRLHLIPFGVTIPDSEIDQELPAKLLAEAEGILAWAVRGARRWCDGGLQRPAELEVAHDHWRAESDALGNFLAERCELGDGDKFKVSASTLYSAFRSWCESNDEERLPQKEFKARMQQDFGIGSKRVSGGNLYLGIRLIQPGTRPM